LILCELLIVIVGRFCGTVGMVSLFTLCKHKRQVTFKQLIFIYYGGLIRGAISFGLVLTLETNENIPNRDVIITTTLALVVITTVVFGSFTAMV
jgi:NhaP-type Na+/H+ or K+/H+ antiporter